MAAVFFDRGKSPVELGLLRRTQWQVVLFEAIPELRNEREALGRGKANYFVTREYGHLLKVRETGARGNVDAKGSQYRHAVRRRRRHRLNQTFAAREAGGNQLAINRLRKAQERA
jgi:hypothetical protein